MSQRRRPERHRPGLKLLTPVETTRMAKATAADRARWQYLFSLNKWKPIK